MANDDLATAESAPAGTKQAVRSPAWYRSTTAALWVVVFAFWTATGRLPHLSGFLFVALGTSALLLTTIAAVGWHAMFRTAQFREAAARAAWTTGALGTVVFFESALLGPSEGLAVGANRLASSFVSSLYGCLLAAGLLAWMLRATPTEGPASPGGTRAGSAWDLWLGRVLFTILIAWPLLHARWSVAGARLVDSISIVHWPAVLVLCGLVAAIRVIGGTRVRERAASAALAGSGTLAALAGLVQALLGMAGADVTAISTGLSFLATSCFTTLIGLALMTFPRDDRSRPREAASGAALASKIAWVLFPLLTVGLMAISFIMILTPMQRRV